MLKPPKPMKNYFLILFFILLFSMTLDCFGLSDSMVTTEGVNNVINSTKKKHPKIDDESIKMKYEIENLKEKINSLNNIFNYAIGFFALFLALGSGFSIWGFIRSEKRSSEIHQLTIESNQTSKERENKIFEESQRTLSLVNETLSLATDASKRASKSLENRLIKTMESLNKDSLEIIELSQAFYDDKNLTTDKDICSEIHRIGRKIEGLENNLVILEDSNIKLEPYCNFIRGADSYLSEQFNQAIQYWVEVTLSANDNKLKSLAYFWIGYVNNNLGYFTRALSNFKKAQELAIDSRKYELIRIQLETRFFNNENPIEIVKEFDNLIRNIDQETTNESISDRERRKVKILTTLGNIYYQMGNEANSGQDKSEYYKKSKDIFVNLLKIDESKDVFKQIYSFSNKKKDSDKWVIFGYAESIFQLEQKELAKDIFKNIVYHLAENEFLNREEKRTKALAKTTQLICAIRAHENEIVINNTKSQVDSALGGIDKRLTIYSQIQRRNVSRDKFREDINKLLGEKFIA